VFPAVRPACYTFGPGGAMAKQSQNQRRATRLHHEIPVAYRTVGSFLTDWATNISQGGLFINTRKPLPVGSEVKIIIQLPGTNVPIDINGKVTRIEAVGNKTNAAPGMAVEFTELDRAKREKIESLVQRLRKDLEPA
jgi:type IV pilus assembly protein PilZ